MKKGPVLAAAFFLGISALTLWESSAIRKDLTLADQLTPLSPDKYLRILAALIAVAAVIYLARELLSRRAPGAVAGAGKFRDLLAAAGIFVAYIISAPWLGYLLSTFLFYFLFLRLVGRYSYPRTAMITVLLTVSFELVFETALQIQFPPAFWNF